MPTLWDETKNSQRIVNWVQRALNGFVVTDIGQIDKYDRRRMNYYTAKGILIRGRDITYPTPKTFWVSETYRGPLPGPVDAAKGKP